VIKLSTPTVLLNLHKVENVILRFILVNCILVIEKVSVSQSQSNYIKWSLLFVQFESNKIVPSKSV
jgi:hypothetical protein